MSFKGNYVLTIDVAVALLDISFSGFEHDMRIPGPSCPSWYDIASADIVAYSFPTGSTGKLTKSLLDAQSGSERTVIRFYQESKVTVPKDT